MAKPQRTAMTVFELTTADKVYQQKAGVKPVKHYYNEDDEPPYVKYGCPICEELAKQFNAVKEGDEEGRFARFSIHEGQKNCPCCGVNFVWDHPDKEPKNKNSEKKRVKEAQE